MAEDDPGIPNPQPSENMLKEITRKLQKTTHEKNALLLPLCITVAVVLVFAVINTQLRSSVAEKKAIITQLQKYLPASSYTGQIRGPGLQSTTINYPTHVIVELNDFTGRPCVLDHVVTAELQIHSVDQSYIFPTTVSMKSSCIYEVRYTALRRGQHKLSVRLYGHEVKGSPFNISVYPNPTQLGTPVRIVRGLNRPWDVAINSHGEMFVSNYRSGKLVLLDNRGQMIRVYDRLGKIKNPTGAAIDSNDNVYVVDDEEVRMYTRDGHFKQSIQYRFDDKKPTYLRGIAIDHGYVYVCDHANYHVVVFSADLNTKNISFPGSKVGQFHEPYDLDFDSEGLAYICDRGKHLIQVLGTSGQFVQQFGQEEGEGKLKNPTAVHVMGEFVYITDHGHDRIAVYHTSGQFVTSFGKHGKEEGEFNAPYGITSDKNGYFYVADFNNDRIQVF